MEGVPARVTGLRLQSRGEIWGWLGDLTELTELRLDGNQLSGPIPSKLSTLTKLTELRLAGNQLQGCVPPPLRRVENHDLALLTLPDCGPPAWLTSERDDYQLGYLPDRRIGEGTYRWFGIQQIGAGDIQWYSIVFDIAPGLKVDVFPVSTDPGHDEDYCAPCHYSYLDRPASGFFLAPASNSEPQWPPDVWFLLYFRTGEVLGRSHHMEEDPLNASFVEQIAASVWATTPGVDSEWTWR